MVVFAPAIFAEWQILSIGHGRHPLTLAIANTDARTFFGLNGEIEA